MRYFIIVLFAAMAFGCNLFSSNDNHEIVNGFKILDLEKIEDSQWESGIYYQATEESGLQASSILEITNLLNTEISKNIPIKSAWYKEHRPSCATPNGMAYQVIVQTTIVIQLDENINDEISDIFKPVKKPQLICPYYFKVIQPIEK